MNDSNGQGRHLIRVADADLDGLLPAYGGRVEEQCAGAFRLLGDRTRLRIVLLLAGGRELNVNQICRALGGMSQPAVSHHLALLRIAGFVAIQREGKFNYYSLSLRENLRSFVPLMAESVESFSTPAAFPYPPSTPVALLPPPVQASTPAVPPPAPVAEAEPAKDGRTAAILQSLSLQYPDGMDVQRRNAVECEVLRVIQLNLEGGKSDADAAQCGKMRFGFEIKRFGREAELSH